MRIDKHCSFTINEDDHGWGAPSAFTRLWAEFRWVRRDGQPYRSQLSFSFPQVMDYKLSIIKELLAYPLDGLFLDWLRTGDVRDNPQTDSQGVANYGYEKPLIEQFKRRFAADPRTLSNNDPRWVRFRAGPSTEFMRRVRKLTRARKKRLPIAVLVAHPWCYRGLGNKIDGNLNGLLLDVPAWARESLIDAACPAGYYRDGGSLDQAYRWLETETAGKADIWSYEWMPKNSEDFAAQAARARAIGAKHILFWEADYLDDLEPAARQVLNRAMAAHK